MMKPYLLSLMAAALVLNTAGCAGNGGGEVATAAATVAVPGYNGRAMGGRQAISGGSVKLWKVNTDGTAATSMLTTPVTTDANGYFTITGDYNNCSATLNPTTQVYLTITGGNAGSGTNAASALMAALGPCGSLTSSTFVVVNEVTTVASVWALQQFMGVTYGVVGAEDVAVNTLAESVTGMKNAFATVPNLVTLSQGSAVSGAANATIEAAKINTIANILATCVNSDGTGNCATLFAAVTPTGGTAPADTIQAALAIATNPANNVAAIYAMQTGIGAPFSPSLTAAPFDWTLAITYTGTGLNIPYLLAADASGNLWITNSPGSPNNGLVELGPTGQAASGSPFISGSSSPVSGPQTVSIDTLGNIWIANDGSSANNLISFPGAGSTVTKYNATANCLPQSMAMDGSNNAFFACGNTGYTNLYEFPNTGTVSSPSYASSPTLIGPIGAKATATAVDPSGNVWVANDSSASVTEFPAGNFANPVTYNVTSGPYGLAVDHSGNIWISGSSYLNELVNNGGGSYTLSSFSGGGLNGARYDAVDGEGNVWVVNANYTTVSSVDYVSVSEFNNNGTAITIDNQASIPGGFAHATNAGSPSPRGIAIDPSGNVWITGCGLSTSCTNNSFVMELVGVASPPVTPLSTATANNQLGCCSFTPASPGGTVPTAPGYITLQAGSYSPVQLGSSLSFLVTRIGGSNGAVSVHYATSNGTAIAGTDYTAQSGTLSWTSGDTSVRTITVPWLPVSTYAGTKTFTVALSSVTGGAAITPNASTLVTVTGNLVSPSTKFTLTGWKEGLPVDIYGGSGGVNSIQFAAAEVTTISSGYSSPYFYLNGSNQIVFTAPSNGAVTSPGVGSDDTRSELRELYTGTGHDSNSDWYANTNSGVGGTMTGSCAVTAVSVDADEATFAQIHGQNNPFILLIYRPAYNDVEVQIETTSAATSGTRTELLTNVSLGDTLTYSINYSAPTTTSAGTLKVSVNDVTKSTASGTQTFTIDSSWSSQGQYFKLGAYSAADHIGNPAGDQTQVLYNSFAVSH
ncbi:MAG: polysaccharide lyase family 7 protein [Acidobacteriaceae bacterium]|nr:polysaccharide lyase family 7 protein [Acidobacteriaceae bacterium]